MNNSVVGTTGPVGTARRTGTSVTAMAANGAHVRLAGPTLVGERGRLASNAVLIGAALSELGRGMHHGSRQRRGGLRWQATSGLVHEW
jgi:hypothetical protein